MAEAVTGAAAPTRTTAVSTAVSLADVTISFRLADGGSYTAVQHASLDVADGEFVSIVGPTGCGKTRLVEHMAGLLGRPAVTVSCHDDLTSSDLVGRYVVTGGDVVCGGATAGYPPLPRGGGARRAVARTASSRSRSKGLARM